MLGWGALLLLWTVQDVAAFQEYLTDFTNDSQYMARGTRLTQTCALCHVNPAGGGPRNAYGQAFEAQLPLRTPFRLATTTEVTAALHRIDGLNSDNGVVPCDTTRDLLDGCNLGEILARAFPGDANDEPPFADAGSTQTVNAGTLVTLDGSLSADQDQQGATAIVSYAWQQLSGPRISGLAAIARPTFTAPSVSQPTPLTFELTVTDNEGAFSRAQVTLNVVPVNQPPIAIAAPPQTVRQSALVTLDGSQSFDPEGTALTFTWRQTAGTPVLLMHQNSPRPTFVAPNVEGGLTFELTVTDAALQPATTLAFVNIGIPPVANAGTAQTVFEGDVVRLDGSQSHDPKGTPLTLAWRQLTGTTVQLADPGTAQPTFTAPAVDAMGSALTFELQVTDGQGFTDISLVSLQVLHDDGTRDQDNDGISDRVENTALNNGDGNNDGVPDRLQAHVVSLQDSVSANTLTLIAPPGTRLVNVRVMDNPSPQDTPPGLVLPLSFLTLTVQGLTPGGAVNVTVLPPAGLQLNTFIAFGRTQALPFAHWYRLTFDETVGITVSLDRLVLHLIDGRDGDDDATADGTIVVAGAFAIQRPLTADTGGGEGGGSGSGGCTLRPGGQRDLMLPGSLWLGLVVIVWRRCRKRSRGLFGS